MSDDTVAVCVDIHEERTTSFGVVRCDAQRGAGGLLGNLSKLIWLPKSEIRLVHIQVGSACVIEIPRWLAEKEGLVDTANEPDPNQGSLL